MSVVLLSGGLDSTALLDYVCQRESHTSVMTISFNYNQRHKVELNYVAKVCGHFDVDNVEVDISAALRPVFSGAKTSQLHTLNALPVPKGRWDAPEQAATIVPNRNMIMLSIAAALAEVRGMGALFIAAHAGDYAVYPDCRPQYFFHLTRAIFLQSGGAVKIETPFINIEKGHALAMGNQSAKFYSENTWSCYEGGVIHCGQCGACQERKAAFKECNMEDTTVYAA